MKGRGVALALILAVLFTGLASIDSYARSRSRSSSKKSTKNKAAVSRKSNKWASRRAAARRHADSYRRAAVARAKSVDNSLLRVAQTHIQGDDPTGEDPEIRQAAVEALGDHPGTVVVMDPNNGKILSMVNQKWALGKPVKPCSTIKLITSIAALSEGLADPDYPMEVSGGEMINMINALARSNNEYFQELGEQLGFEQVINYCREWGLGEVTGINMDGESPGFVPKYKNPRAVSHMCSHGDDIGITALQLAVLTSGIANGGYIYQPQILRTDKERKDFKPVLMRKVEIADKDREKIIEGMLGAVSYGTARRSGVATLNVAGKTGSCNGDESKLGLFASFTSPTNPELVVVVIATGSSQRGSVSAVVAGEIYSKLAHRLGKPARPRRVNTETSAATEPSLK